MSVTGDMLDENIEWGVESERRRLAPVIGELREALESAIAAMQSLAGTPGLGVHRLKQIEEWRALVESARLAADGSE